MPDWTIKVVDRAGAVTNTLDNAAFGSVSWALNGAGEMDFEIHNYDPDQADVVLIAKEVQLFRDATLIWWGVPVRAESSPTRVRVSCRGLLWYFSRRFIGKADRTNLVLNPQFETGLTSWTTVGSTTATADTTQRILGTQSAKLVSATAQLDNYITQSVSVTGTEIGTLYTLVGWYRVQNTGWLGEALGKRGLTISRVVGGLIQQTSVYEVDGASPRESWQRAEVTIWVPPNAAETLAIRLYSPGGTIWWDALSLTAMESLSNYNTDQTEIARQIVVHAQDTVYDKSALLIATSTPASGVLRDRHYQHADHHNVGRSLEEFTTLSNGFDYDVVYTSTVRTFTTYYPRKGGTPTQLDFTAARLVDWTLRFDGEDACSSITVLGDGDGPDREEGAAVDLTVFSGVVLEDVIQALPGAQIDSLDSAATEALRIRKVAKVLTVTVPAVDTAAAITYIGNVNVGDVGTPVLAEGFSTISGDWRVVRMSLDSSDAMVFELNPV